MCPVLADGAPAALALLADARRCSEPFDYMLLDVQMPGLDGFQLAERLQGDPECHSSILLMLSSSPSPLDARRCRELGISAYLTKPIARDDIAEAILQARAERRGRPGPPAAATVATTGGPVRSLKILLAEDNRVNQTLAVRLLEKQGHSVAVVDNGELAVRAVADDDFDLVLMDVQMPGMDGLAATAEIRRQQDGAARRTPIVALTAHAMRGDEERCLEAGMDAYLTKPIDSRTLARTLRDLLA
jgi:CheY-like chemotaxis protein